MSLKSVGKISRKRRRIKEGEKNGRRIKGEQENMWIREEGGREAGKGRRGRRERKGGEDKEPVRERAKKI